MSYAFPSPHAAGTRPFAAVQPIIDATNSADAVRQIMSFIARNQQFTAGVPDTSFFPFSAICKLRITFPGAAGGGTGFFIRPNLILTCGHNLYHSSHGRATTVTVRPGQRDASTWLDSFSASPSDWTLHPQWEASHATNASYDLACIRTSRSAPGGTYFDLINYCPAAEEPIAVCGYSAQDVDGTRQHLDIDRVRSLSADYEMVAYNLQTRAGGSGSPVFAHYPSHDSGSFDPGSIPVMGVHTRGVGAMLNSGVLLTPEKNDWARGGGIMSVAEGFGLSGQGARMMLGGLPLNGMRRDQLGNLPLGPAARAQGLMAQPFKRAWIVADTRATGGLSVSKRTFGHPSHDASGKTTLSVRVPNLPSGGSVRWHIPDAGHRARMLFETGGGTAESVSGTSVTLQALAGGPAAVDCMVRNSAGKTVESNKYWVSVPQFVLVALHPTADAFLTATGLGPRRAAVVAEMGATLRHIYRNVNVRFVMPGEALPAHLGVAANAAFPGGVEALPGVQYAEVIGDEAVPDPERSRDEGADRPYRPGILGRNHMPGEMNAPLDRHTLARGIVHRFGTEFAEVAAVQAATAGGTLPAVEMDAAAVMFGRLMGENLAHEVGHSLAGTFVPHEAGGHLMGPGDIRTFRQRSGMTQNAAGPILTDHGRATLSELSPDLLRVFEEFLPVNPPLDRAAERTRGRVGSFSHGNGAGRGGAGGWVNGAGTRAFSGETVHLPGAVVLEGWKARAFVAALDTALQAAMSANPGLRLLAPFVNIDSVLDACDRWNVTLGFGPSLTGGVQGGGSGGFGVVFAPGRRIGFYGSYSGIIGWVYSIGASATITVIHGGPENFGGQSRIATVSVETIGWFTEGLIGAPIAAHVISDTSGRTLGYAFEVGVSAGVPVLSLIEAYGQFAETATTFGRNGSERPRAGAVAFSAPDVSGEARSAAMDEALAAGATEAEAAAFVDSLFH